jgi:hypothetical protein
MFKMNNNPMPRLRYNVRTVTVPLDIVSLIALVKDDLT